MNVKDIIGTLNPFNKDKKGSESAASTYRCWLCNEIFDDPMVYLLHIHLCNMKHGNYDFMMSEEKKEAEEENLKVQ